MKIIQIATSPAETCGIGLFARNLEHALRQSGGAEVWTIDRLAVPRPADIVLLQHHGELLGDADVIRFCRECPLPVVLFAHDDGARTLCRHVAGLVAMCEGMVPDAGAPVLVFPHPAWVPDELEDRAALRQSIGLPDAAMLIGSHGFLKFDRQFVEIVEAVLPHALENNWHLVLAASPWRLASPGVAEQLAGIRQRCPGHFTFDFRFLDTVSLNRRLQACDLLWCWTREPSSPYASGVISDQYASGSRIVAADKQQHAHILALPNVVRAPDRLAAFIDRLVGEARLGRRARHSPRPVGWRDGAAALIAFLEKLAG